MPDKPVTVVDRLIERYNAQDLEGVVDVYAEDAVVVSGGEFRGKDAVREHFESLRAQFGEATLEKRDVHASGDVVVLECLHHARLPGAGEVSFPMAMVFRVQDGLIREDRGYVEPGAFAAILQGAAEASDVREATP